MRTINDLGMLIFGGSFFGLIMGGIIVLIVLGLMGKIKRRETEEEEIEGFYGKSYNKYK